MSKKVTYSCELCREVTSLEELVGLLWQGDERRWKAVSPTQVDFPHLCKRCLKSLSNRPDA